MTFNNFCLMKYIFTILILGVLINFNAQNKYSKQPKCKKVEGIELKINESLGKVPKDYTGIAKKCNKGKVISLIPYKDGLMHGVVYNWWPNGNLRGEANFKLGKPNGGRREWHLNGKMSFEGGYGGATRRWNNKGQIKDSTVLDNEGSGMIFKWDFLGRFLESECPIVNNRKNGTKKVYYSNGKIRKLENYRDGKFISEQCFNKEGSRIKCE